MGMDFTNKTALVTGGANGIGLSCIQELLNNGIKGVIMADVDEINGMKIAPELNKDKVHFVRCDVTDQSQFENAFKEAIKRFGHLDIVINNAGVHNEARWELNIDINCKGVTRGTLLAFDYMGKDKGYNGGYVVNIASLYGLQVSPSSPIYSSTKHYVVCLGYAMGHDFYYKQTGVKLLTICPSYTNTQMPEKCQAMDRFKDQDKFAMQQNSQLPIQEVDAVSKAVITTLNKDENGSVWTVADGKVYQHKCLEHIMP